ncbi:MAG: hypothetical protein FWC66_00285 [Oscillospiraceae bacterium]|nr:hypothetical protein [Oscillospiraceae bacterium]
MQNAVYGIFRKGRIVFNEPVTAPDESNVIVVFLDKPKNELRQDNNRLLSIFDTLGIWEDSRDTETIIADIENSRVSRAVDVAI